MMKSVYTILIIWKNKYYFEDKNQNPQATKEDVWNFDKNDKEID